MPDWLRKLLDWWNRKPVPPPPPPATDVLATLHNLHNIQRSQRGADALDVDAKLMAAAQRHATWMARTGQLTHTGEAGYRSFSDRISREGYQMAVGGENIAHGYRTPQDVMAGWMNSSGHRQNILNPAFDHVGYGVVSGDGNLYWCAVFASPFFSRDAGDIEESLPQPLLFSEQHPNADFV